MPTSRKRKKKTIKKKRHANLNGVPPAIDRKLRNKMEEAGHIYSSKVKHEHTVSELILDFVKPEQKLCFTKEDVRGLIPIGIACWNLALLPDKAQEEQIQILLSKLQPGVGVEERVRGLVTRKKKYFDEYKYLVARHELIFMPDGTPHLSVASAKID